ncbi:otospiralin-like [Mugil cephalus]|uniref:otospiralin-like n=1 Tax=Mugil cephalus TaxID=48193 RepID=UPI001FB7DE67|nr:otospiralin-like [Mugil cephalus]
MSFTFLLAVIIMFCTFLLQRLLKIITSPRQAFCVLSLGCSMHAVSVSVLLCSLLLSFLPPTEGSEAAGGKEERQKRSLPYWGMWSSDFYGWLEELRAQAADSGIQDLARTFWAHFPISNGLGYDSPESDPQLEE